MKKLLAILILSVICLGGCEKFQLINGLHSDRLLRLETSQVETDKDDMRLKVMRDSGFYYYNPVTKNCYWVIMFYRAVSTSKVACREEVVDKLINKNELNGFLP